MVERASTSSPRTWTAPPREAAPKTSEQPRAAGVAAASETPASVRARSASTREDALLRYGAAERTAAARWQSMVPASTPDDVARAAIDRKIDPASGMMDPELARQLGTLEQGPTVRSGEPPVWHRDFRDASGAAQARVYAYERDGQMAVFEVPGAHLAAETALGADRTGRPVSGREHLSPQHPMYAQLAEHLPPGVREGRFVNYESGVMLEAAGAMSFIGKDGRVTPVSVETPAAGKLPPLGAPGPNATSAEWEAWMKRDVGPALAEHGVSADELRRVIAWGKSEGIYNIANNRAYGQADGSRQSPLTFTNFYDSHRRPERTGGVNVNGETSAPDPADYDKTPRSGDWQVGIGGIQVSDAIRWGGMKRAFGELYPDATPQQVGQRMLDRMGEGGAAFPDLTIDQLARPENAKWAGVLLHDPYMNVLIQSWNPNLP